MKKTLIAAAVALAAASGAIAAPTYTYSVAPSGAYPDTGGTELTDGQIGGDNWTADPAKWVGWQGLVWDNNPDDNHGSAHYFAPYVRIDFQFAEPVTLVPQRRRFAPSYRNVRSASAVTSESYPVSSPSFEYESGER